MLPMKPPTRPKSQNQDIGYRGVCEMIHDFLPGIEQAAPTLGGTEESGLALWGEV